MKSGFVEVTGDKVIVLTSGAETPEQVDVAGARADSREGRYRPEDAGRRHARVRRRHGSQELGPGAHRGDQELGGQQLAASCVRSRLETARLAALVACVAGCAADNGTRIRLTVHSQPSFQLSALEVAAAGKTATSPVSDQLVIVVPERWTTGPVEVEVWGLRSAARVAHGSVVVMPIPGATVLGEVTLVACVGDCTGATLDGGVATDGGVLTDAGALPDGAVGLDAMTRDAATCVPPTAQGTCDTRPQCGCATGENCSIGTGIDTICMASGTTPDYAACTGTGAGQCKAGSGCVQTFPPDGIVPRSVRPSVAPPPIVAALANVCFRSGAERRFRGRTSALPRVIRSIRPAMMRPTSLVVGV